MQIARRTMRPHKAWFFTAVVTVGSLIMQLASPLVYAALPSAADLDALNGPWVNWVAEQGSGCSDTSSSGISSVAISGNHPKDAYDTLKAAGYSAQQAAGIVGNLMQESHPEINPTATDGVAFGIAQWQGSRLPTMRAWVAAHGQEPSSFAGQLAFLVYDLQHDYSNVATAVKATSTVSDATIQFELKYESAGQPEMPKRIAFANTVYSSYSGDTTGGTVATNAGGTSGQCSAAGSTGSSGSPDCQTATGTAKILCEAEKYNGIFYVFGAGHAGYDAFRQGCPITSIATEAAKSTVGSPGPCATDCSSLVSIAVDVAFGQKFMWTVSEGSDAQMSQPQYWQEVSVGNAQSGDIVTRPGHVEIFDHAAGGQVITFGSHHTGTKTSSSQVSPTYYTHAFHYIGPGVK